MAYDTLTTFNRYIGSSTEIKPTAGVPVGSSYRETNTGDIYQYGSTGWVRANPNLESAVFACTDTITRGNSATIYVAGDIVSDSTVTPSLFTFEYVGAPGQLAMIMNLRLEIGHTAVPAACEGYRLHIYNEIPSSSAYYDYEPYSIYSADRTKYCGWMDIAVPTLFGATAYSCNPSVNMVCSLTSTNLYGILQCKAGETPSTGKPYAIYIDGVII